MVKTWARHKTTETLWNNGWLMAVSGWWLVAVGDWRLAVGGSWLLHWELYCCIHTPFPVLPFSLHESQLVTKHSSAFIGPQPQQLPRLHTPCTHTYTHKLMWLEFVIAPCSGFFQIASVQVSYTAPFS